MSIQYPVVGFEHESSLITTRSGLPPYCLAPFYWIGLSLCQLNNKVTHRRKGRQFFDKYFSVLRQKTRKIDNWVAINAVFKMITMTCLSSDCYWKLFFRKIEKEKIMFFARSSNPVGSCSVVEKLSRICSQVNWGIQQQVWVV